MKILYRLYEDYFKKSRLPQYENLLRYAKEHRYQVVGVLEFFDLVNDNKINNNSRIIINRHDIDTSPKVARKMFLIEKKVLGQEGSSTFYFRNSTLNVELIKEIEQSGYETGYHYEDVAAYTKKKGLKNRESILKELPAIREQFKRSLSNYRAITGTESATVASHGDFINTRYDIQSVEILKDISLRKELGILVEAYDNSICSLVNERFADQVLLAGFSNKVVESINNNVPCIMMLTHPRNWEVDVWANTVENFVRLFEDLRYRLLLLFNSKR